MSPLHALGAFLAVTPTEEYILAMGGAASQVQQDTGVPAAYVLGQWGLESGWGKEQAAGIGLNNPGNITSGGQVQSYQTISRGLTAYEATLTGNAAAATQATTPAQFGQALQAAGYAGSDTSYGAKVSNAIATVFNSLHLGSLDAALLPPGTPTQASGTPGGAAVASGPSVQAAAGVWLGAHAGNVGLVIFGGVMILALIVFSLRGKNVLEVVKHAAS